VKKKCKEVFIISVKIIILTLVYFFVGMIFCLLDIFYNQGMQITAICYFLLYNISVIVNGILAVLMGLVFYSWILKRKWQRTANNLFYVVVLSYLLAVFIAGLVVFGFLASAM